LDICKFFQILGQNYEIIVSVSAIVYLAEVSVGVISINLNLEVGFVTQFKAIVKDLLFMFNLVLVAEHKKLNFRYCILQCVNLNN
jgi:hypothetical protein